MTTVLVASASIHTTAAACDYLGPRLDGGDAVVVLGVAEPDTAARDLDDAANVARTRLVEPAVETETREGDPVECISAAADERGVDGIVVGAARGDPEAAGEPPGSTVRAMIAAGRWPVTVLPEPGG